jgi:hypothetical protein
MTAVHPVAFANITERQQGWLRALWPQIEFLPGDRGWVSEYYEWLKQQRNAELWGSLIMPRYMAEHDYGSMPREASFSWWDGNAYIIPGELPATFNGSTAEYRKMWGQVFSVAIQFERLTLCVNIACFEESAPAEHSTLAMIEELTARNDLYVH